MRYLLPLEEDPFQQTNVQQYYDKSLVTFKKISAMAAQKQVRLILVDDVPQLKLPVRVSPCIFQSSLGLPNSCDSKRTLSLHAREPMTRLFKEVSKQSGVFYWDPHPYICTSETCTFQNEEFIKSMDFNHITKRQAEELAPYFGKFLKKQDVIQSP